VPRITRKELKSDKFALEVEHTVTFFEEHQKEIIRYGGIGLVVLAIVFGVVLYQRHQHSVRQEALGRAIQVQEAPVGAAPPGAVSFPTQDAKDQEALKVFTDIQKQWPGSDEGQIAEYYLGCIRSDQGKLAEAEKSFLQVADHGSAQYSSLAKLSLAQIYFSDGRADQGEKVLRDLMAHPTAYVSKDMATVTLARLLIPKKPAEARKLLDPLRSQPGPISSVVLALYGEIPPQ
jgi:predicted negative regulator of RcsB-dependent stress response